MYIKVSSVYDVLNLTRTYLYVDTTDGILLSVLTPKYGRKLSWECI